MRLNLGCGRDIRKGFVNIDIREIPGAVRMDISDSKNMKMYAGTEYILANDIIEHFPQGEIEEIIKCWAGLLRPGGKLTVQCPDVRHAVEVAPNDDWLIKLLYGGQDYPENFHKAGFTLKTMIRLLESLGMVINRAQLTKSGNMVVEAVKCG